MMPMAGSDLDTFPRSMVCAATASATRAFLGVRDVAGEGEVDFNSSRVGRTGEAPAATDFFSNILDGVELTLITEDPELRLQGNDGWACLGASFS